MGEIAQYRLNKYNSYNWLKQWVWRKSNDYVMTQSLFANLNLRGKVGFREFGGDSGQQDELRQKKITRVGRRY